MFYHIDCRCFMKRENSHAALACIRLEDEKSFFIVQGKARKLGETPGFSKDCSWSTLPTIEGDYMAFQNAIDTIIKHKGLSINRIEFDFLFWDQAKDIQDKKREEQRKLVENIWRKFDKSHWDIY